MAVLQPEEHASNVRAVQRATGTLVGTALIAVLTIATAEEWVMVAGQAVAGSSGRARPDPPYGLLMNDACSILGR